PPEPLAASRAAAVGRPLTPVLHVPVVDRERPDSAISTKLKELPDLISYGKPVVLHGQYPELVFIEWKAFQDCELGALGVETPVVDHWRSRPLVKDGSHGTSRFLHRERPAAGILRDMERRFCMLQVSGVIRIDDATKAVRRLQEVDRAFAVVKTTVQTKRPAVFYQCSKIRRVRLNADPLPAEGGLEEHRIIPLHSV